MRWMDPRRETRLWPHEYGSVYQAFDRIFGCRGHGWSNVQAIHVNLPFSGDDEFARLSAAVRLLLPILPALAASSPIVEGRTTDFQDNRVEFYRTNSARVPSVTAEVIPEPVFTRTDYEREILAPLYRDIAPYDPEGVLRHEFLDARAGLLSLRRRTYHGWAGLRGAVSSGERQGKQSPPPDLGLDTDRVVSRARIEHPRRDLQPTTLWVDHRVPHLFLRRPVHHDPQGARLDPGGRKGRRERHRAPGRRRGGS